MKKWVCPVCGYVHEGDVPPAECPVCHVSGEKFLLQSEEKSWAAEHVVGVGKVFGDDVPEEVRQEIIDGLNLSLDLSPEFEKIAENFAAAAGEDYAASRGEYLNGIVMANYLGYTYIDSAEAICFDENGNFLADKTDEVLSERLKDLDNAVVPGFYGAKPDGSVKTFSRGGSDITGSIVAKAVHADIYENWTDVSGFLVTDPRIVKDPEVISTITYRELRELSYMGATVLHEDSIFPLRQEGIPIHVLNTNAPQDPGTMIVENTCSKPKFTITGIAGKKGFASITVESHPHDIHITKEAPNYSVDDK